MKAILSALFLALVCISCEVKPQPIVFGQDACTYCGMTIVDMKHAAQLVTTTSKDYNFDSIECLVNYHKENPDKKPGLLLVADYKDGALINANKATYLQSPKIASPMAANISAFKERAEAESVKEQAEGQLHSWEELPQLINK